MTFNLIWLDHALMALLAAIASAAIPVLLSWGSQVLGLHLDKQHRDALTTTINNAIGVVLSAAQNAGDARLGNVSIKNAALGSALQYVLENAPSAVAHFGLSDDAIAQKVAAQLAIVLHVTNSTPASAPAPVTVPVAPTPNV